MQAIMVMLSLLLQKPHGRAGAKEFGKHLERRMVLWKAGKIAEFLDEAKTIQSRLPEMDCRIGLTSEKIDGRFATLMSKGEVNTALSLITAHGKGGVLPLTPEKCGLLCRPNPLPPNWPHQTSFFQGNHQR